MKRKAISHYGACNVKLCHFDWYISHGNIHEINTWKRPIQTQCVYRLSALC